VVPKGPEIGGGQMGRARWEKGIQKVRSKELHLTSPNRGKYLHPKRGATTKGKSPLWRSGPVRRENLFTLPPPGGKEGRSGKKGN